MAQTPRPLDGIRVLEVGQLLAGPFAGSMLAYYGAEVIKVEPPGDGDPLRQWRILDEEGTSYWWRSLGRNKKCVTADLKTEEGRDLVRRLAGKCEALVENFRPGVMERWGLGPADLWQANPGLVYARISGYGQDGPYASRPGFASVCEGVGGLRYVNGQPGEAPMRPNLSLGDSIAGLHAALGIVMACLYQARHPGSRGQVIDTALYEASFNLLEGVIPEYDGAGVVRQPSGSTLTGIVPTNTYRCADGRFIIIGANGDSIFKRLCQAMGRPDMGADIRLTHNAGRVEHESEIDQAIEQWTASLGSAEVLASLEQARVPSGPIYSVADMMGDPHFNARGLFEEVDVNGEPLKVPAMVPKFSDTPGRTEWAGPEVGSFNGEVYGELLGLSEAELAELAEKGIL
ncbi:MAG: CoA transferase [Xanthomonadales bacterium]|nr:CoA transferase [Gammaproteobacteria bacterium]MBT8051626.1 CoA transferase [Gammaproteobacteria bacterium]MBT8057677.1 CoA transferase [Gammaproteobacteria bacterium]NNJ77731.1 CoA transferase [Xanthomonadales bacterium]NNL04934.1 CoA transferase [Xanthomonadales bacterium]